MENHDIKKQVDNVCRNIQRHRLAKGYSQIFLAGKAGIGVSSLRRIEKCEIGLSVERLIAIANAFEIEVIDLLK